MLPLVVVGCIKAVWSVREATTASGVDNAASPRLADTAEQDYYPQKADHYAKTTGRSQKYIIERSADRVAHIDGQLAGFIIVSNTHALPAEYKCLK